MKKSNKQLFGAVIVILSIIGLALASAGIIKLQAYQTSTFDGCTWAADYGWVQCCLDTSQNIQITQIPPFSYTCPNAEDVKDCLVINSGSNGNSYCNSLAPSLATGAVFERGITFNSVSPFCGTATVKVEKQILIRSGLAGSCQGSHAEGAQGCSWGLPTGMTWADGTTGVKDIPFGSGNSQQYVISQHLLSCPSTCIDPMQCSLPSSLNNFITSYNGKNYPAYTTCVGTSCITHVVGCKPTASQVCLNRSADFTQCLQWGQGSECGDISTPNAGQCALNSDCASIGNYQCNVNPTTHIGVCVPFSGNQACNFDYDCTQTGQACQNKQLSGVACVNHVCSNTPKTVECCAQSDCSTGYFCNTNPLLGADHTCVVSQNNLGDCVFDCCDSAVNSLDSLYKQKACSGGQTCCSDHVCQADAATCILNGHGAGGNQSTCPPIFGFLPNIPCMITQWLAGINAWWSALWGGVIGFFMLLGILIAVAVFALTLSVMRGFAVKEKGDKVGWVIALVVALVAAYIAYTLWWVGVIVFIVMLILKSIVGGTLGGLRGFSRAKARN